ncbi:hypothetical protein M436DRAFT_54210 [Aureobasidium namibiae CBS 147.97]|uniref:Mtf2-like C-terminal domain-containing protein n=1 Tax=Aureobasidium namibiae CBS 147.97 TaxID=1043004 RepID=A0A074WF29_9PEZI
MSGCANAGQALTRGLKLHASRSAYTLPFLYQTPTLRRYYSALQDLAKENAPKTAPNLRIPRPPREPEPATPSREDKPEYEEYVPFDTPGAEESAVVQTTIQGESLTGTERNAFAKLEALGTAPTRRAARIRKPSTEKDSFENLDDVLNQAITAIEISEAAEHKRERKAPYKKPKRSEYDNLNLVSSAAEPEKPDKAAQDESDSAHLNLQDSLTLKSLHRATTDTALWSILETRLFSQIALLHLDSSAPTSSSSSSSSATISPERRHFLLQIFPLRLVSAASLLRNNFPNSNLILAILPRVKQLGESAYALATSPDLYNQLLAFQFRKFADVDACNDLLQEMDDNVVEPSFSTLRVLDYMLQFRQDSIEKNLLGSNVRSLFTTEKYRREFAILERWRSKVEQSLAEQQSRLQRNADNEEMRLREEQEEQGPIRYIDTLDKKDNAERAQLREKGDYREAQKYKFDKLIE